MGRFGTWSMLPMSFVLMLGCIGTGMAQEHGFPFDHELMLDARPMYNSKRVPSLEITANGTASIDLWCRSGQGQALVSAQEITIVPGAMSEQQCAPERMRGDDDVLSLLSQVTTWRREGDTLVLIGPQTLRFRLTNN